MIRLRSPMGSVEVNVEVNVEVGGRGDSGNAIIRWSLLTATPSVREYCAMVTR